MRYDFNRPSPKYGSAKAQKPSDERPKARRQDPVFDVDPIFAGDIPVQLCPTLGCLSLPCVLLALSCCLLQNLPQIGTPHTPVQDPYSGSARPYGACVHIEALFLAVGSAPQVLHMRPGREPAKAADSWLALL